MYRRTFFNLAEYVLNKAFIYKGRLVDWLDIDVERKLEALEERLMELEPYDPEQVRKLKAYQLEVTKQVYPQDLSWDD